MRAKKTRADAVVHGQLEVDFDTICKSWRKLVCGSKKVKPDTVICNGSQSENEPEAGVDFLHRSRRQPPDPLDEAGFIEGDDLGHVDD